MTTPKILMIARSLPCHVRGGLEYHVVDLAMGLTAKGAEVELLSTPVPDSYRRELESSGLKVHEVPGVPAGRYSFPYFRRVGAVIRRLQKERGFDVIHAHEFGFGFAPPSEEEVGAKIVLSVHGTITSETPLHPDVFRALSPRMKGWAWARFGRRKLFAPWWHRALDRASLILVDSQWTADELKRIRSAVQSKIHRIPLGLDRSRYPSLDHDEGQKKMSWTKSGEAILMTVGRLEWQKGHDVALRALNQLKDLPWRYVIAGEGRERKHLESLARQLDLTDRVEFLGRIDDPTKSSALAGADLFLWPERTHPAFGLVGLEAMLMGTPLVASRRGAIPDLMDPQSGWLFNSDDPENLAGTLRPLLVNSTPLVDARKGLRERTLERFKPEVMTERTLNWY